jgi:hypothetical protein
VNVNTAPPEVLSALIAGVQPAHSSAQGVVEEIVAKRQEKQLKNLNEAVQDNGLRTALGKVADVKSTHFRIESVGVVGSVQKKIVAVLRREAQQGTQANQQQGTQANQQNAATAAKQMTMLYFKVE